MKTPCLAALGNDELVVIQGSYLYPDVVERLETKGLFNGDGVRLLFLFRITLDKQTVAYMLEITIMRHWPNKSPASPPS